ncbi:uncharacterized protein LTR77_001866 [Saxophila tyrrhenica]|uniref:Uncharacterized protein n=1 Tax=Saxophila tyrrhenica TaxID=1690608 RepID=A0AAV9PLC2_9PEZI|nr:hypothetical protein LTR77_001866 [Saxophila tyrrhenica]
MVNTTQLALLATAVLSATAMEIDFHRFSTDKCEEAYHIRKDTELHDPHCKTFSENEVPFSSFMIKPSDELDEDRDNICTLTAYSMADCKGQAEVFPQMRDYMGLCSPLQQIAAHSVKISCVPKPKPEPTTPIVSFVSHTMEPPHSDPTYVYSMTNAPEPTPAEPTPTEHKTVILYPGNDDHADDSTWLKCSIDGNGNRVNKRGEAC